MPSCGTAGNAEARFKVRERQRGKFLKEASEPDQPCRRRERGAPTLVGQKTRHHDVSHTDTRRLAHISSGAKRRGESGSWTTT